jgi:hypothetical protein
VNTTRSHAWIDRRSLALARATAARIARKPELLEVARDNLLRWKSTLGHWPADLQTWEQVLAGGVEAALAQLTEDSPRGRRLRQSSPFAGVLTPQERQAIFDEYESGAA